MIFGSYLAMAIPSSSDMNCHSPFDLARGGVGGGVSQRQEGFLVPSWERGGSLKIVANYLL